MKSFWEGFDPQRGRRKSWTWGFGPGPWGEGESSGRRPFSRGPRLFDQGDLKYVILQLLAEKPRHGYEIIKELEDRCGGMYAPSAGAVYPTLTLLEDLGFAQSAIEEGTTGKKVYSITESGRQHLAENRSTVEDLFERIADFGAGFLSDGMRDVGRSFARLAGMTFSQAGTYSRNRETSRRVKEILDRAADELDRVLKGQAPSPPDQKAEAESAG